MKRFTLFALFVLSGALSGCQKFKPEDLQGSYLGTWSIEGGESVPVRATVELPAAGEAQAKVRCVAGDRPCDWVLDFRAVGKREVSLVADGFIDAPVELRWRNETDRRPCVNDSAEEPRQELCSMEGGWVLSFVDSGGKKNFVTFAKKDDSGAENAIRAFETPRPYTLSEVLQRAYSRDFSTRLEYQRYLEQRFEAKSMLRSQTPHLNLGTVTSILDGSLGAILQMAGDVLPFLLPSRWLQAKEASDQALAEYESFAAIRLNAVSAAEMIGLAYARDSETVRALRSQRASVTKIYDEIVQREKLGQLPADGSLDVLAILNATDQAVLQVESSLEQDLEGLALAAGFANPKAISSLDATDLVDETPVESLDVDALAEEAFAIAPESRQITWLERAARANKLERYFTFLDPNAPPNGSLGAAMFPSQKIADAQIREIQALGEQMHAVIANKIAALATQIAFERKGIVQAETALRIQASRIRRTREQLQFGTNFALADLVGALQDQVQSRVAEIANRAVERASLAQLRRLIGVGRYARLFVIAREDEKAMSPQAPADPDATKDGTPKP